MISCIEKLKSLLAEQTPCYGYDDAHSILEMLYYYYSVSNPIDNAVIRCQFKELHDALHRLSIQESDTLFEVTGQLCASHERQAFIDGVKVGMRLFLELEMG